MISLEINKIHKSYKQRNLRDFEISKEKPFFIFKKEKSEKRALDDVSFSLSSGLYGLLGPNGAGKSTLMNIIAGLLPADSGEVLWNGEIVHGTELEFRRIFGFMPQQQRLYDHFTGYRFLNYMCVLKEIPKEEIDAQILRTAEIANLTDVLKKRLSSYSGGMKQRLLLAAALLGDPKLVILDEPTAGLDPKERVRLRENLADLAHDRIILVATHVVSDVESVADGILFLKDGHLIDFDSPENLIKKYAPGCGLEEVYLHIFEGDGSP